MLLFIKKKSLEKGINQSEFSYFLQSYFNISTKTWSYSTYVLNYVQNVLTQTILEEAKNRNFTFIAYLNANSFLNETVLG